jgi:hypothetical protein
MSRMNKINFYKVYFMFYPFVTFRNLIQCCFGDSAKEHEDSITHKYFIVVVVLLISFYSVSVAYRSIHLSHSLIK